MKTCTYPGCPNRLHGRGYCCTHLLRIKKFGSPDITKLIRGDDVTRFWSKVDRRGDDECWPWSGTINDDGYAKLHVDGKSVSAHIWAYEHFVGPIPEGHQLDHVKANGCTIRHCVNYLRHLEPVTGAVNTRRGSTAKLTQEVVASLRERFANGERQVDLAEEFGVHPQTVHTAIKGKTWKPEAA